ncbi:hypothetical protein GOBAR_AA16429 [Gossypium barbadense]|uniref:Uncharacterized protein n=1 Tax=Gossypium barbadense TaxID=3634 RepID=A0A2P5XLL6_GOSBA|nr:hypothetical protein GOBAR_AA16429 [Gossypium barbadense]
MWLLEESCYAEVELLWELNKHLNVPERLHAIGEGLSRWAMRIKREKDGKMIYLNSRLNALYNAPPNNETLEEIIEAKLDLNLEIDKIEIVIKEMRELKERIPAPVNKMNLIWMPPQEPFVKALDFARDMGFTHVQMEGNSRTTIVKINQVLPDFSDMGTYIKEIKIKVEDLPAVAEVYLAKDLAGMASQF